MRKKSKILASVLLDKKAKDKARKLDDFLKKHLTEIEALNLKEGDYTIYIKVDKNRAVKVGVPPNTSV